MWILILFDIIIQIMLKLFCLSLYLHLYLYLMLYYFILLISSYMFRNCSFFQMASGCWWYYFSKFTEFFDTIFFVMRKRYDQVSTLHVIHHGIMPVSVWWGVKFTPGGHSSFFGFLNTFVHIIMYTYYMLAAMGPHMQKYLWWKRYLTVLQMVGFIDIS